MHIGKTWVFILLFSLSLNFCGECNDTKQNHSGESNFAHVHISDTTDSEELATFCDTCHNCHVKIVSNNLKSEATDIYITKPHFEQQDSLIVSNTTQLLKPPIS